MAGKSSAADVRRQALTDALSGVSRGDRTSLRTVYEMTSAKLFGVIVRIIPERERAEDILQDVYLKVWNRAGRFDPALGSPITWLATIARNTAIDEVRRRGRIDQGDDSGLDELADDSPAVDDMMCKSEDHDAVRRCIDALEHNQRRSIRLAFFGGLSHSQLAEKVDVPLGTIKSWIRRGLESLKGCMGYGRA